MRWFHSGSRSIVRYVAMAAVVLACVAFAGARPGSAPAPVLILHDSSGAYGFIGAEHAVMLRNLLGHFDVTVTTQPVSAYRAGQIAQHAVTFYVGSTYDEIGYLAPGSAGRTNYDRFLSEVATATKPVVWMNYNLWSLAWNWNAAWGAATFAEKFGFEFIYNDDMASYNRVVYNGTELHKGVVVHASPGSAMSGCTIEPGAGTYGPYACSTELGLVRITNGALAQMKAEATSTISGARAPYVTKGQHLWFVGDMPFSYIGEEDRYLAIADLLHDILGVNHATQRRALVRLEDITPNYDLAALQAAATTLQTLNAPYSVALIPFFEDPSGATNGGVPQSVRLRGSQVASFLRTEVSAGRASIIQHGTTHQWNTANNPYNRVSGDDFEFFRVTQNPDGSLTFAGPLPGDSTTSARNVVSRGRTEIYNAMSRQLPFAFEVPHYTASAVDYAAIGTYYAKHYSRMVYFATSSTSRFVGQFFPYYIVKDAYGASIIPENLHNIEPEPFEGYRVLLPADLIRHAQKAMVVRDGYASFFYHPYLGTTYLDETVRGIQALGYTFVKASTITN